MEDLKDINFLATIEGQDYEESLRKIVSNLVFSDIFNISNPNPLFFIREFWIFLLISLGLYTAPLHSSWSISHYQGYPEMARQSFYSWRNRIGHTRGFDHWRRLQYQTRCKLHSNALRFLSRSASRSNTFRSQSIKPTKILWSCSRQNTKSRRKPYLTKQKDFIELTLVCLRRLKMSLEV